MDVCRFLAVVIWFWYGIFGLNNRETNPIECDDMAHSLRIETNIYVYIVYAESMKTFKTYIVNNSNNKQTHRDTHAQRR